jgi:protein subunit release factor A
MLQKRLQPFIDRFEEINELLISPDITSDIKKMTQLSKEQSSIEPVVNAAKEYIQVIEDIAREVKLFKKLNGFTVEKGKQLYDFRNI